MAEAASWGVASFRSGVCRVITSARFPVSWNEARKAVSVVRSDCVASDLTLCQFSSQRLGEADNPALSPE